MERVVTSATWAALGDALGFIAELAGPAMLRHRAGGEFVRGVVPWSRRIGGRFGPEIELPRGCYSDDTQLRLATGRAIGERGDFDIEAFSKVELPVWTSYALGAGVGTTKAADNLRRESVSWYGNFYSGYVHGGGNGAAMRIQPHVWASAERANGDAMLSDVARNTVATHGHPRALVGAAFHALALRTCLRTVSVPTPADWHVLLDDVNARLLPAMMSDLHLRTAWLPQWGRSADQDFAGEVGRVVGEMHDYVRVLEPITSGQGNVAAQYVAAIKAIGAFDEATRGSATKTAILAATNAWLFRDKPLQGLLAAANALGSDTDTIGTMSGAILGACAEVGPCEEICDYEYICQEAIRLARIAIGQSAPRFSYPDLLDWNPPRTALDAVGYVEEEKTLALAGLGPLQLEGKAVKLTGKQSIQLSWGRLQFGQRILVKMRQEPRVLQKHDRPFASAPQESGARMAAPRSSDSDTMVRSRGELGVRQPGLWDAAASATGSLDDLSQFAIASGLDARIVGECLLRAADSELGVEHAIAFAAIVAKARRARVKRARSEGTASSHSDTGGA